MKYWMMVTAIAAALLYPRGVGAAPLTLTFDTDPSGIALGGSGTSHASIAFGSVQAYGGVVPAGVTKAVNGTTNWKLSTPLDVRVTKTGVVSGSYTLTAQLKSADAAHTWNFGSATITNAFPAVVTTTGIYGSTTPYNLSLTIPFSAASGAVSNTLDIIVTSN